MKNFSKKNPLKIGVIGGGIILCAVVEYYFHFILRMEIIYTHIFYVPIILGAYWWGLKGGLGTSLILGFIHLFPHILTANLMSQNIAGSLLFVVVGLMVGVISDQRNRTIAHLQRVTRKLKRTQANLIKSQKHLEAWSKSLEQTVQERINELTTLFEVSKVLGSTFNIHEVLEFILKSSLHILHANTGSVMLLDEETKELRIRAAKGLSQEAVEKTRLKLGEGIAGWVAKMEKPLLISNISKDTRFKKFKSKEELYSALCVPLKVEDKIIGVLNVGATYLHEFTKDDLRTLSILAGEAAVAIRNAQLFTQLEELYMETVKAFVKAIEAKDTYTSGHSEHVTSYAVTIARELGLTKEEIDTIRTASLLHDIGKIGVDEDILNKPAKLTREEYDKVKKHPLIATQIIGHIPLFKKVIPIIFHHHEHYDGNGYVSGLRGEEIPLGSRILGVADAFDAMTSERPYRPAYTLEGAVKELKKNAGSQFDPKIVEVLCTLIEKSKLPKIEER